MQEGVEGKDIGEKVGRPGKYFIQKSGLIANYNNTERERENESDWLDSSRTYIHSMYMRSPRMQQNKRMEGKKKVQAMEMEGQRGSPVFGHLHGQLGKWGNSNV